MRDIILTSRKEKGRKENTGMNKKIVTIISVLTLSVMVLLGGCGEQTVSTLEDIAAGNPEIMQSIQEGIETPEGMSAEVTFSGDSFDINLKLSEEMSDDEQNAMITGFNSSAEGFAGTCKTAISSIEEQTEITGVICRINIINSVGDKIWSRTYDSEGVVDTDKTEEEGE